MSTAALAKKSVKARFCNKKNDLAKLREDLRQRCKLRMREQRKELLNQKRFGVSSDDDVQNKLKEIFHTEFNELTTTEDYEVPKGTADLIKKLIDNVEPTEPLTEDEKLIVEEYQKFKEEGTSTLLKDDES